MNTARITRRSTLWLSLALAACTTTPEAPKIAVQIPKAETLICSPQEIQQRIALDSARTTRSTEEVEAVIGCNRGAIESLYQKEVFGYVNEAKGTVVVELKVEPEGNVSNARIVSSELKPNKRFESELVELLKSLKFVESKVETTVVTFPLSFKPPVPGKPWQGRRTGTVNLARSL